MLINFKVKGYKVFNNEIDLSFIANKKIKNKDYIINFNEIEILKSAIIYGPNNTGKSTIIDALNLLKNIIKTGKIIEGISYHFDYNFFDESKIISFEIQFIENNIKFKYLLTFGHEKGIIDESLYINNDLLFNRIKKNNDSDLQNAIDLINNYPNMLIISILPSKYKKYTDCINNFFENMIILKKNFDFDEVINDLMSYSKTEMIKFNNIMKSADVSIDNLSINDEFSKSNIKLKLFSEYIMKNKKISMPSFITDSDGTKVFMYYMVNILKCLKTGGIIIADEIDRSLHTILTKNIITIFNDEQNMKAQLLATSHDLLLLDCLYLFRKDQIWFTYKDNNELYLYSLDNFKCNKDSQIRTKTMESYLKGFFGALPHPNIEEYIFEK